MTTQTVTIEGVNFAFSVNQGQDKDNVPEVVVTITDYADKDVMVIAAFDQGGLTLCGDNVHLAFEGDEVFCEEVSS